MRTGKLKSSFFNVILLATLTVLLFAGSVQGGIFGIENYPGGKTVEKFIIEEPDNEAPPRNYLFEVVPEGDTFNITDIIESPNRELEDVTSGFGASGAAGGANARYEEEDSPNLDLSPLSVIDDRNLEIKPNQNYLLPDGARLRTGETQEIAGIEVVIGTFIHPNYSNQRARIGFIPGPAVIVCLLVFFVLVVALAILGIYPVKEERGGKVLEEEPGYEWRREENDEECESSDG